MMQHVFPTPKNNKLNLATVVLASRIERQRHIDGHYDVKGERFLLTMCTQPALVRAKKHIRLIRPKNHIRLTRPALLFDDSKSLWCCVMVS
jgi:hypothetical protein